jgi:hypothetical protein
LAGRRFIATADPSVISASRASAAVVRRRQRCAEGDGHRIRHRSGRFQKKPSTLEAEDAAPDAIEVDRDDRHVEAADDPLEAALERQHVAGAADGAFGKDADDVARSSSCAAVSIDASASRPAAIGIAFISFSSGWKAQCSKYGGRRGSG